MCDCAPAGLSLAGAQSTLIVAGVGQHTIRVELTEETLGPVNLVAELHPSDWPDAVTWAQVTVKPQAGTLAV